MVVGDWGKMDSVNLDHEGYQDDQDVYLDRSNRDDYYQAQEGHLDMPYNSFRGCDGDVALSPPSSFYDDAVWFLAA